MAQVGAFGVNYSKTWDGVTVPLPAKVGEVGSLPVGEFVFVQADGAIDQFAFVKIATDGQAAQLTTTNAGSTGLLIGVAQVAVVDNEYFWVWVGGLRGGGVGSGIKGKILTGYVAGNNLFTTSTAGAADDASTTKIAYVVGLAATTGTQAVELLSTGHLKVN
jgi:hypothetical protein